MYEEPTIVDLVKDKSGAELFKELYRLLPILSFEDYFKNGIWQNDLMRLDIEVIDAHRREAGAPDPPPMEEVEFPPLPGNSQATSLGGLIRALVPTPGVVMPPGNPLAAMARVGFQAVGGLESGATSPGGEAMAPTEAKGAPMAPGPCASPMAKSAAPAAPPLDMKVIALFVSKWKLDPARAKNALEKLTAARRRYVMQNFKHIPANGSTGSSSEKLEEYIGQCEQTGSCLAFPVMLLRHAWGCFAALAIPVASFSNVQCTAAVCPKDQRPVRKLQGPKIWAVGCDVGGNATLHRCCVEKEICMRTCGMPWKKCGRFFEKCAEKVCDTDDDCMALADEADEVITGGTSHFAVCKAYRDAQQQLCDCFSAKDFADRAAAEARLTDFYAAYVPQRLVDGKVKDIEEVWKKWQNREAELFYELARKYRAEVEMRRHSEADMDRLRNANQRSEAQPPEAKLEEVVDESEQRLRQRLEEEEALAEKEISQRKALLAELEAAKASAVQAEDFIRAKEIKQQLDLDAAAEAAASASSDGGVKRPLEQSESEEANKRQNTGTISSKSMAASKASSKAAAKSAA